MVTVRVPCSKSKVSSERYCHKNIHAIRNTYAKYESPISFGKDVIGNVKVFEK